MQKKLPEVEYRFDKVEEREWESCLNWELHREICRRNDLPAPRPWRRLSPKAKAEFRRTCFIDIMGKTKPVTLSPPPIYGSKVELVTGVEGHSAECVTLEFLVHWECSDTSLRDGFAEIISNWLEQQRRTNPSARHYAGVKQGVGAPINVLGKLAWLAAWRLYYLAALTETSAIEERLHDLLIILTVRRREDESERKDIAAGTKDVGLNGNLRKWLKKIDKLLTDNTLTR